MSIQISRIIDRAKSTIKCLALWSFCVPVRLLAVLCLLVVCTGFLFVSLSAPPNLLTGIPASTAIYDKDGELIHLSLSGDDKYRLYTVFEALPPNLIKATLAYEDQDFYEHHGIDIMALIRAGYQSYIARERRIGASTISMQVARLKWQIKSTTVAGKLQQIFRALSLEWHYSKAEILNAYFNLAPYGANIEGVAAASYIYFNKPVNELNSLEALSLAVIPQNPNKRAPTSAKGIARNLSARTRLFNTHKALFPSLDINLLGLPLNYSNRQGLPKIAPHFSQFVIDRNTAISSLSASNHIYTSLDQRLQNGLGKVLSESLNDMQEQNVHNASVLVANYKTMTIEAMLGSADFNNLAIQGQVNGTIAKRSPGSTLKPLLYGLSLDAGIIHPSSMLRDLPNSYAGFSPENADKKFAGLISASDALVMSRNLPAVELQKALMNTDSMGLYGALQSFGVELLPEQHYGLALSLGGMEISMYDLVQIYSSIANGGYVYPLSHQHNHQQDEITRVLSPEASFLLLTILSSQDNLFTSTSDKRYLSSQQHPQVAWKTGTSWGFRDAWSIAITGDYVVAVWVGNFDGSANPAFKGAQSAGKILFALIEQLVTLGKLPKDWNFDSIKPKDLNIKQVELCKTTGELYEQGCPTSVSGLFIPGTSPIRSSDTYRPVLVDLKTGLRACDILKGPIAERHYAFWPSDFKRMPNLYRLLPDHPPKWHPKCRTSIDNSVRDAAKDSIHSVAPVIESPQSSLRYLATEQATEPATEPPIEKISSEDSNNLGMVANISLKARVDGAVSKVHWFINEQHFTSVDALTLVTFQAPVGRQKITVSDDLGLRSTVYIKVELP